MATDHLTWACEGDFLDHVVFIRATRCWAWTGRGKGAHGFHVYGGYTFGGLFHFAHRLAYELFNGPIPPGMCVLHRCDIPFCVNPVHLFLGTRGDNAADRVRKERTRIYFPRLSASGRFRIKLTEEQVPQIRALAAGGMNNAAIAKQFGVQRTTIRDIVHRRTWTHI
jgi:hypothetical protein